MWSETNQQLTQLAADLLGPEALTAGHALELRAAARARQHHRGRHDRDPQEHRRRAGARPAAAAVGRRRHELRVHRRPAGDQAHRARPAGAPLDVRARARGRRGRALRRRAVARARRAGLARHRRGRGARRPGPRRRRAGDPARGARLRLAATPFLGDGAGRRGARAGRLATRSASAGCPAWPPGELVGAVGTARDGVAELVADAAAADVLVLVEADGVGARGRPRGGRVEPVAAIDPTRRYARVRRRRRAARRRRGRRRRPRARWPSPPSSSASASARWR